jgi:hypothetical protein
MFFRKKIQEFIKNTKADLFDDPLMCVFALVSVAILIALVYVLYKNRHGIVGARNEAKQMVGYVAKRINPFSTSNQLKGKELTNANKKSTPETFQNVSRLQGAPLSSNSNLTPAVDPEAAKVTASKYGCNESKWGCCPDNRTTSADYYGSNCWDYPVGEKRYQTAMETGSFSNGLGTMGAGSSNNANKPVNKLVNKAVVQKENNSVMKNANKSRNFDNTSRSMKELIDKDQSGWILSHTKVSVDCCPSTYTTSTGCICDDQLFVNTQFPTANKDPCAASFMKSNLLGLSAPSTYKDSESVMNAPGNVMETTKNVRSNEEPEPTTSMVGSAFYKSDKMGQTF